MKIKAVIFDMDGTVLSTAEDLRDSLAHAFFQQNMDFPYSVRQVQTFFGSGIGIAIERALAVHYGFPETLLEWIGRSKKERSDAPLSDAERREFERMSDFLALPAQQDLAERIRKDFSVWYPAHSSIHTKPYKGICEMLDELKRRGILRAVVSNKIDAAVQNLVQTFFPGRFETAIGERKELLRKPAPDMVLRAMETMHVSAAETVYVGDSEIDLLTAENAGLFCISAAWGFRSEEFLKKHGARCIAGSPEDLRTKLESPV